jgi:hypothetical protein
MEGKTVQEQEGICTATCDLFKGIPDLDNGCPIAELRICRLPPVFVSGQVLAMLHSTAEQVEAQANLRETIRSG